MSLDEHPFVKAVSRDSSLHVIRHLAHSDHECSPPAWAFTALNHVYVRETRNLVSRLLWAFEDSKGLITQCKTPPPDSWLASVGLDGFGYAQQQVDSFTAILYSALDRTLHLVSQVLGLSIAPRNVRFSTVLPRLRVLEPGMAAALEDLRAAGNPLALPRHRLLHRGERRRVELFSEVRRAKQCVSAFNPDDATIRFNLDAARAALITEMATDYSRMKSGVSEVLGLLTDPYQLGLAKVGGVDSPTPVEVKRANEMVAYLGGGDRPYWLPDEPVEPGA